MSIKEEMEARQSHRRILGKRLVNNEITLHELVAEDPTVLFGYKKLKDDLKEYRLDCVEAKPDCEGFTNWDEDFELYDKTFKKRHYWFWSSMPDRGKTTFLKSLAEKHRAYFYQFDEKFQDIPVSAQFVLCDEYTEPYLKATQLNRMCDGTYAYPNKGGTARIVNYPYVIICGNKNPAKLYPNAFKFLEARFNVVNVDEKAE